MSECKGRGIFAKDDIESGELILLEKAFFYKITSDKDKSNEMLKRTHIEELSEKIKNSQFRLFLQTSNKDYCDIDVFRPGIYSKSNLKEKEYHIADEDMDKVEETLM